MFRNCSTDYQAKEIALDKAEVQACKEQTSDCGAKDAVQEAVHGDELKEERAQSQNEIFTCQPFEDQDPDWEEMDAAYDKVLDAETARLAEKWSRRQSRNTPKDMNASKACNR